MGGEAPQFRWAKPGELRTGKIQFRVEGLGLRVEGLGFRVEGLGFRV